jgi:hypothetical protein
VPVGCPNVPGMKNSGSRFTTRYLSGVTAAGVRSNIYDNTLLLPWRLEGARPIRLLITRGPGSEIPQTCRPRKLPGSAGDRRAQGAQHGPSGLLVFVFRPPSRADGDQGGRAAAVRSFAPARHYSGSLTHCQPRVSWCTPLTRKVPAASDKSATTRAS